MSPTKCYGARIGPDRAFRRSKETSRNSMHCPSEKPQKGKFCMTTPRGCFRSEARFEVAQNDLMNWLVGPRRGKFEEPDRPMPTFDQSVEKLPREQLRALQFQKLQEGLRRVFGRNRFYQKKWREGGPTTDDVQ